MRYIRIALALGTLVTLSSGCAYTTYHTSKPVVPAGQRHVGVKAEDGETLAITRGTAHLIDGREVELSEYLAVPLEDRDPILAVTETEANICGGIAAPLGGVAGAYLGLAAGIILQGCGSIYDSRCSDELFVAGLLSGLVAGAYWAARGGAELCAENDQPGTIR